MKVQEYVHLAQHTTFKIGGLARYFIEVTSATEVVAALEYAQAKKVPFFILAGGSNTLVSDDGFDGVVIKMNLTKKDIDATTGIVKADAGCMLMEIILATTSQKLKGMESMYGIPGTVGGAARGNAGAFGTEMTDVVTSVTALNIETGKERTFNHNECAFDYRTSFFKKNPEWIILSVQLKLTKDTEGTALQIAKDTLALRNERQIQDIKSAGSFFMNPVVSEKLQKQFEKEKGTPAKEKRVPAGWLIEKSGFKGAVEGNVATGVRSANYIINTGKGTAEEVARLAETIRAKVFADFNVALKEEITQVGF